MEADGGLMRRAFGGNDLLFNAVCPRITKRNRQNNGLVFVLISHPQIVIYVRHYLNKNKSGFMVSMSVWDGVGFVFGSSLMFFFSSFLPLARLSFIASYQLNWPQPRTPEILN